MIGVAFSIHETFGAANDIERVAIARVASHLARTPGRDGEAAILARLADRPDAAFAAPSIVMEAFCAALGPALSSHVNVAALEGLIRVAAARVAAERFVPDPGVSDVLQALSELNVPRVALSLRWPGVDQRKAETVRFDGEIIFAGDTPADESGLAPFIRIAAALRLPTDQIFFVGSNPRTELQPAALAGMQTVRLNRDGAPYPADLRPPDFTIATIDELLPILSGPYTRGLLALRHIMRTALGWRDGHFVPNDADVLPGLSPANDEKR